MPLLQPAAEARPRLSQKKREKIETYARETPLSVRAIAKEVGVGHSTAGKIVKEARSR